MIMASGQAFAAEIREFLADSVAFKLLT